MTNISPFLTSSADILGATTYHASDGKSFSEALALNKYSSGSESLLQTGLQGHKMGQISQVQLPELLTSRLPLDHQCHKSSSYALQTVRQCSCLCPWSYQCCSTGALCFAFSAVLISHSSDVFKSCCTQITPGIYRILNVGADAIAQSVVPDGPVFVSNFEILVFPPPSFVRFHSCIVLT